MGFRAQEGSGEECARGVLDWKKGLENAKINNMEGYRKDLVEKLKETPKEARRTILKNAQSTEEYATAKNLYRTSKKEKITWTIEEYNQKIRLEKDGQLNILSNFAISQILNSDSGIKKHFLSDQMTEFLLERGYLKAENYLNESWNHAENHEIRSGHLGADDKNNIQALYKKAIITAEFIAKKRGVIPNEILEKIIENGGYWIYGRGDNSDISFSDIGMSIAKQNPDFAQKLQQVYIKNNKKLDAAKISGALGDTEKAKELLREFSTNKGGYTSYDGQHGWYSTNDKVLSAFIKTSLKLGLTDVLKEDVSKLLALAIDPKEDKDGYPWYSIAGSELLALADNDISFVEDILSKTNEEDNKKYAHELFNIEILKKIWGKDKNYILDNKEKILKMVSASNNYYSKIRFALLIDDKDFFNQSVLELPESRIEGIIKDVPIESEEYINIILGTNKLKESIVSTKDKITAYINEKKMMNAINLAEDLIYTDLDYTLSFYRKILKKEIPVEKYELARLIVTIEKDVRLKEALAEDVDFDIIRESMPKLIREDSDLIFNLLNEGGKNIHEIDKKGKEHLISKAVLVNDENFLTFFGQTLSLGERKTLMDKLGGKALLFSKIGSLMNHTDISRKDLIETGNKYPFILDALESNKRYGDKLLSWFSKFDKLSVQNIKQLYESKEGIVSKDPEIDQYSLKFRQGVQEKLKTYKNNPKILKALEKKRVNLDEWLNYEAEDFFDLGKEEQTKFSEVVKTPIERIKETVDKYTGVVRENIDDYQKELSNHLVVIENIEEINQKIEKMKVEMEKAKTEGNAKKAQGIQKGIDGLEQKLKNPKKISTWLKLTGGLDAVNQIKEKIFRMQEDMLKDEEEASKVETLDLPVKEKRQKAFGLKEKLNKDQNEFKKELDILENRLENFQKSLPELIESALGKERMQSITQALNQETSEQFDHYRSDYSTLRKLFAEQEGEEGKLEGRPMRIQVWARNPDIDLYLGNYTNCCIRIDSTHMGSECTIADYITDLGMQVVEVIDEKTNEPIAALWLFIGEDEKGKPAIVIDNIETNTEYSNKFKKQLEKKLTKYMQEYTEAIKMKKFVQGESNNDLVIAKMTGEYMKLGGYNRSDGYYLEAEPD